MKINGALKPHQGASGQGSSPGVVPRKYRNKRYFKHTTITITQIRKRDGKFSDSHRNPNAEYSIRTKKQIQTTPNTCTTQSRISKITNGNKFCINLKSGPDKNKREQKGVASTFPEQAIKFKNNKQINIEINFKQNTAIVNTTTRQLCNRKLNIENTKYKSNNMNCFEKKIEQVTANTSKDHVTLNKKQINKPGCIRKEVNKSLFTAKLFENLNFTLIIHLKLFLLSMFSHAMKLLNGNPFTTYCGGSGRFGNKTSNLSLMLLSASQFHERICFKNTKKVNSSIAFYMVVYAVTVILLPQAVIGDDGDNFFPINGIETTTPEFDYASRGQKKFGDKCENTLECGFPGSICDPKKKSCQCTEDLPVTNHIDKCGKEAAVNESCFFNEQCEVKYFQTECRDQRCVCRFDMTPVWLKDGSVECKGRGDKKGPETYIDPAMIGVLIGMALMFIIICVVLRLFSQARWRENRTIFNTPNPRLMNVSLLRESKLLHGQERRGSRMSVRAPSRQPSMASLRPHSPNPSLGKTGSRSNSHGSNASATSIRSTRSNSVSPAGIAVGNNSHHERKGSTYQPHQHQQPPQLQTPHITEQQEQQHLMQPNIISNPVAETVTVEIIEPEK